jgi:hypothetical protein
VRLSVQTLELTVVHRRQNPLRPCKKITMVQPLQLRIPANGPDALRLPYEKVCHDIINRKATDKPAGRSLFVSTSRIKSLEPVVAGSKKWQIYHLTAHDVNINEALH